MHSDENGEPGDAYAYAYDDECESMLGVVGQCRKEHAPAKGTSPRWHRVELRLDGAIAVTFDDRRREQGVAIRRYDKTEVAEARHNDLVVFEHLDDVFAADRSLGTRLALVLTKSSRDIGSLIIPEPFRMFRKCW